MNKLNFTSKSNGDILDASEWNSLVKTTDEIVDAVNNGGSGAVSTEADPTDADKTFLKVGDVLIGELTVKGDKGTNVGISGDNNINIEPRAAAGTGEGKNTPGLADRKGGNIALKPGDDIEFWAHHRGTSKNDEVSIKMLTEVPKTSDPTKTDEVAAKLQLNTADIVLTSKDKAEDSDVMNVTVNKAANTRGYLKVRAQAIDLRCEENGGIALQPKGTDGQGNMNKIKFEHGGGDGLEFGTFNTEKTSIFTDEYRFNKEGVWKMATRTKVASDKADENDPTTAYKYVKAADDFYDNIAQDDEQCTTKDIIKTAYAMNGGKDRHTKITKKGAIEISTNATYQIHFGLDENWTAQPANISTISTKIASEILSVNQPPVVFEGKVYNAGDFDNDALPDTTGTVGYECGRGYFVSFTEIPAPDIKIDSGAGLKLGGILDFGSSFNFGETDGGIEVQNKYTKKGALKDCGKLKVIAVNNNSSAHTFNTLWDPTANSNNGGSVTETTVSVPAGESMQIAEASIYDIIKLVNYMKDNNEGPWASNP